MTKKRRILAAAMCLALTLVMAASAAYIILEAHHHCTGDGCPVCREIQVCRQILTALGTAAPGAAVCRASAGRPVEAPRLLRRAAQAVTLISLKVKLSD